MPGIYAVYADTTHTNKENPDEASHRSILAQEKKLHGDGMQRGAVHI
jgi:hypothetical protein